MKMAGIADNIVNLFENSKETWRTDLTACHESLGEVDIRRDFLGGFFFTFAFVVFLVPLLIILMRQTSDI